jgi:pyridoxine kinase
VTGRLTEIGNHTGYKVFQGTKTLPSQIWDLFAGMDSVHAADQLDVILSGYLPSAEAIQMVGKIVEKIREKRPAAFWSKIQASIVQG